MTVCAWAHIVQACMVRQCVHVWPYSSSLYYSVCMGVCACAGMAVCDVYVYACMRSVCEWANIDPSLYGATVCACACMDSLCAWAYIDPSLYYSVCVRPHVQCVHGHIDPSLYGATVLPPLNECPGSRLDQSGSHATMLEKAFDYCLHLYNCGLLYVCVYVCVCE